MSPLPKERSDDRSKRLEKCVEILSRWMTKWAALSPTRPVTKLQMATFAESLLDLSSEQLERGCAEYTKTGTRFPWPGDIRIAAKDAGDGEYLGPRLLDYTETVTPEEREEALKFSQKLKEMLLLDKKNEAPHPTPKKIIAPRQSTLSIAEQKEILRKKGFLK